MSAPFGLALMSYLRRPSLARKVPASAHMEATHVFGSKKGALLPKSCAAHPIVVVVVVTALMAV